MINPNKFEYLYYNKAELRKYPCKNSLNGINRLAILNYVYVKALKNASVSRDHKEQKI
jgi:hypothetical protein